VPNDTNGFEDVFVRDTVNGTTVRVNTDSSGGEADADAFDVVLSADGRYVAFDSYATNLVAGDTNLKRDVFVHDLVTGVTVRADVDSAGLEAKRGGAYPSLSSDGRFVAFSSETPNLTSGDTNRAWDVFVHDFQTGTTERVSVDSSGAEANGASLNPSISADGRFVAFETLATNLVAGDTNASWDIFVHDRLGGSTTLVSLTDRGTPSNASSLASSISGDGSRVAFKSIATDMVEGDGNGVQDIFLRDLVRGTTERISVASDGTQANEYCSSPALSADGQHVAFYSPASDLVPRDTNGEPDLFVRSFGKVRRR
jgi:Tol biopolymer transport system component